MKNKTISLPEEVYNKLRMQKRKDESFPDLIDRLIKEKKSKKQQLETLAGSLKEDNEWDQILEEIYKERNRPARS